MFVHPSTELKESTSDLGSIFGTLYFPEFQKQVRRGAVLKYEVR